MLPDCDKAAKSIFTSIGMIISQISTATGRLTLAISAQPMPMEDRGKEVAERDAGDDAKSDPNGQIASECRHSQTRLSRRVFAVARLRKVAIGQAAAGLRERQAGRR